MSLQKKTPLVIQRRLAERLGRVLPSTVLVTQGYDASGNPQLVLGDATPATLEQNFYIRIIETPATNFGTDSVGQAATSYGPHVIQVVMEGTVIAGGQAVPTASNQAQVISSCVLQGTRVEIYVTTVGTVPVVGSITSAQLVSTIDEDLMFGLYAGR